MLLLILALGLIIGNRFPYWSGNTISWYRRWRWVKEMAPTEVDESKMCLERHQWIEIDAINEVGELGKVRVCDLCGFIPSKNIMIPPMGMQRLKETQQALLMEERIRKDFSDMEKSTIQESFRSEIEKGVKLEDLMGLYIAGQSSKQRFILYKAARVEEMNKSN